MRERKTRVQSMDRMYFINQKEITLRKEKDILLKRIAQLDKTLLEIKKIKYQNQHQEIDEEQEQYEEFILKF